MGVAFSLGGKKVDKKNPASIELDGLGILIMQDIRFARELFNSSSWKRLPDSSRNIYCLLRCLSDDFLNPVSVTQKELSSLGRIDSKTKGYSEHTIDKALKLLSSGDNPLIAITKERYKPNWYEFKWERQFLTDKNEYNTDPAKPTNNFPQSSQKNFPEQTSIHFTASANFAFSGILIDYNVSPQYMRTERPQNVQASAIFAVSRARLDSLDLKESRLATTLESSALEDSLENKKEEKANTPVSDESSRRIPNSNSKANSEVMEEKGEKKARPQNQTGEALFEVAKIEKRELNEWIEEMRSLGIKLDHTQRSLAERRTGHELRIIKMWFIDAKVKNVKQAKLRLWGHLQGWMKIADDTAYGGLRWKDGGTSDFDYSNYWIECKRLDQIKLTKATHKKEINQKEDKKLKRIGIELNDKNERSFTNALADELEVERPNLKGL